MRAIQFLFLVIFLSGCIGTDYVDDPTVPERVVISPNIDSLEVGQTVQFSATFFNEFGQEEQAAIAWKSTAPQVVSISGNGLATGLAAGPASIIASAENASDTLILNTAGVSNSTDLRTGTFQDVPGSHYHASGGVRLEYQADGKLKLFFENDFSTSAGPSLYVLLANHTNGSYSVTNGGNAVSGTSAQITPTRLLDFSGAASFEVPDGVGIGDYDYVVLYCTLGPVFGYAKLN
ncbi:MAG: DM13 domain-containing protein [Bacteroidota bacterium]